MENGSSPPGAAASTASTLDDVAREAGVSRATASRAINGGNRVSPSARKAVEEAVRRLAYAPNPAARSLVRRRTDSVAVVVPEPDERVFSDPFFARTLRGVTEVLSSRDLQLVLLLARPGEEEARMLRYLRSRHVDGALVVSHHRSGLADHLADLELPCVFIGRPWTSADRVAYVDTDNVAGGRQATEVLLARGCRRIGTIAGPADMTAGLDRLTGWRQALRAAGLATDAVVHGDFTEESGERAVAELLAQHPDLDGLVIASDLMAAGALRHLRRDGVAVPEDLALVGYDDLGVAERTDPLLTTVHHPVREMAEQATRLLLDQVDGRGTAQALRLVFPPSVVRRASA